MKYIFVALALAAEAGAQAPVVSIRPNTAALLPDSGVAIVGVGRTGVPILGYMVGPGALDIRTIVGTGKTAQLGAKMLVPTNAKRLFAPPREHYLLLEDRAGQPLAVWSPSKAVVAAKPDATVISGAIANPDAVFFSSRGDAAVVYTKTNDRLQVISGLPGEPVVSSQPGIGTQGEISTFVVSDDGAVVLAQFADTSVTASIRGAAWQRVPAAYGARALAFVPNTHDAVMSDAAQQTLTILPAIGEKSQTPRILAQGIEADRLAFTKEADQLLAASSSQSKLWTIDLKTATPELGPSTPIDTLLPLRDGRTFLLSASGLSLLHVPVAGDGVIGLVTVTR